MIMIVIVKSKSRSSSHIVKFTCKRCQQGLLATTSEKTIIMISILTAQMIMTKKVIEIWKSSRKIVHRKKARRKITSLYSDSKHQLSRNGKKPYRICLSQKFRNIQTTWRVIWPLRKISATKTQLNLLTAALNF